MAREELSWPVCGYVVGQDPVDVAERGDVRLVLPGGDQQRLLSIFDGAREGGQVGENSRDIVSCPLLLITGIPPSYPASRETVASLEPGNRSADAHTGNRVGVEAIAGQIEAGAEFGGDLLKPGGSSRVEVGEPGLCGPVPFVVRGGLWRRFHPFATYDV